MSLSPSDRSSKIIVAVDDEAESLMLLKGLIEGAGFMFMHARGGAECAALVSRVQPRLILLDIEMPNGMDGFTTCRRLRMNPLLRTVPIVFLTGRKSGEDVQECLKAGGNDFIIKPFDPVKLIERVEYWSSRRLA